MFGMDRGATAGSFVFFRSVTGLGGAAPDIADDVAEIVGPYGFKPFGHEGVFTLLTAGDIGGFQIGVMPPGWRICTRVSFSLAMRAEY